MKLIPPFGGPSMRPLAVCLLGLLLACSGKSGKGAPVVGTGAARDASADDDGAVPLQLPDAGNFDTKIYSGARYLCGYDKQDMHELPGSSAYEEVAIATDERGFALVHHDQPGNVWIEAMPIAGQAKDPVALFAASERAGHAAIVASGLHFLLAWSAGNDTASVLRTRELTTTDHPVVELTQQLAPSALGGELSALLGLDDGFIAAFLEQVGTNRELRLQRIGVDGQLVGNQQTVDGVGARAPEDLHLAQLDGGAMLLAWLERDDKGQGHVMAQPLNPDLGKRGDPIELSKNAVHDARFDLSARRNSEGLIYHALDGDVRDAIKYRRVDPQGAATQAVLNIVNAPGRARDGSIAAFGQGYAIAYRELPSLGVDHPGVHLAFVNQFGEVVHRAELAQSTEAGGRTTVSATTDGHVLVGWTTELPSGATTQALALYCPGALVLCGGGMN